MSHDPEDLDPDDDFQDPDAWLDTDFPTDSEEEFEHYRKLQRLRHPPPTIIRVFGANGPPIEFDAAILAHALEVADDGADQVVRLREHPDEVIWRGHGRVELVDQSHLGTQPVQPTLIRYPSEDPIIGRVEQAIPGSVSDYEIDQLGDIWTVTAIPTKHRIYSGPGPVEIVQSPAPF